MDGRVDPQSGYQQREPELDIPPFQSKGVQFEATFSQPTYTVGPSTQLSFTKPSFEPTFIEPPHTEIPPPQAPLTPDHAPWMDLSTQISSLSTRMEEFAVVSDTWFYSMENRMDQYQAGFTFQFEYLQQRFVRIADHMDQHQAGFTLQFEHLQQRIECIEDRLERKHEEMMAYLRFVFLPPPP